MKTATLVTALSILVFVSTLLGGVADATPDAVLDIDGKKIRSGVDYYILPVIRGRGGGLTLGARGLGSTRNQSCPLNVVQEQHEILNGIPLTFSSANPKKGVVRLSTDLNIKFSTATICVQSTVWKLENFDESTRQWFVSIGGVEGNPGPATVDNWFKIEKYKDDYKLVFCPTVCNFCKVLCRDIGIFIVHDGRRLLALTDVPFKVMFKKA